MKLRLRKLLSDQGGGASIYTSMIIMVILMLAALSFATIMSRNYQQTTENQLNAQAFYAAETGIGDARARLLELLDSYGRGVRDSLPASLGDITDPSSPDYSPKYANWNTLLGLLPTGIGRAVALDSSDRLLISTQAGDVYYVTIGTRVCEDTNGNTYLAPTSLSTCQAAITLAGESYGPNPFTAGTASSVNLVAEPPGPPATSSDFGSVLAVSNDCMFIGDPGYDSARGAVFTYQRSGTGWVLRDTETFQGGGAVNDYFGQSLAVASDGSLVVIGTPGWNALGNNNAGRAHIYYSDANCFLNLVNDLVPHEQHVANAQFGAAVAFGGTDSVAVGGPGMYSNRGAVAVYHIADFTAPSTINLESDFLVEGSQYQMGKSLALHKTHLIVGAPDIGKVFTYEYKGNVLRRWELKKTLGPGNSQFGASLGLNGNYLAVGAPEHGSGDVGAVHVYQYKDGGWDNRVDEREGNNAGDNLGKSLSLRGKDLAGGAPGASAQEDGLHLFRIKSLGDLSLEELSALLEQQCVNRDDPDTDFYNFDLLEVEEGIYYSWSEY